jgi:integrase
MGIDLLGDVRPHGLRRTYATLRIACGDAPRRVSQQLGHEDVTFSMNVYAQATAPRGRMTESEQREYDRAIEWASWSETVEPVTMLEAVAA